MKMKKLTILPASAALMFAACSEPLEEAAEIEPTPSMLDEHLTINGDAEDTPIVLGEKLNNPYTLDNMRLAIEELNKKHLTKSAIRTDIKPTHYYIKFKPKNEDDINRLESDTTIFFYSYPLDYEIIECGSNYHDPELPADVPTYQYCAVAVDQKLPDVEYEILEELYILEDVNVYEDGKGNCKPSLSKRAKVDYWEELEDEAVELAGLNTNKQPTLKSKKWNPLGRISYKDNFRNGIVPLEGVPVHIRKNMFVGHQCCTDEYGRFAFSKLKGRVDYSIKWKRSDFKIKPNTGANAAETTLKKDSKSDCIVVFEHGGNAWKYASVFRAAHYYYYGDIGKLTRPKNSSLAIRASDKEPSDKYGCFREKLGTDIHIYYMNTRDSRDIFATTIHELAHQAHHDFSNVYSSCETIVKESWARGVQWYLTNRYWYNGYIPDYHTNYTLIIPDLHDYDQKNFIGHDLVHGYTIEQSENAISNAKTWNDWKTNLKNLYNNETEKYLDDLFNAWGNY